MTIFMFFLMMASDGIPAIAIPIAVICDTLLLIVAMLTGVIHA